MRGTFTGKAAYRRGISPRLAPLVQELELEASPVVTLAELYERVGLDHVYVRRMVADLVQRGWLRHVARGTYEFMPGAAAGAYPSGDPWIPLRAELLRERASTPSGAELRARWHVGATSAAWLLGYAQRAPQRHLVVGPALVRVPLVLREHYQVLRTRVARASADRDGLPVPTPAELFAELAQLAPRLQLDASLGWMCRLLDDVHVDEALHALEGRSTAAFVRAGFFADVCGQAKLADAIDVAAVRRTGPYYTGAVGSDAPFYARWEVFDTGRLATR
jgi:hypothetical protein